MEGKTIGSYTLQRLLGQGGMGSVYLAEHATIGRKAAIKILDPDIACDAEAVSRFFTEARAVNDIRHPNIVDVTDFGRFDSLYCIVMEYLEGETLAARLDHERTLDEPTVVRITKQCLSALGAAHDRGLVHRDLKPENIFLSSHPDYPDFVKLLDFGIAKLLASDSPLGHHTKTGSVLGTPAYMSPEQSLGESALDIRSDIYSLGVVIYEMLIGRPPFSGDTLGRLIICHVNEQAVPPIVHDPSISRAMNDIVMRALEKKPKDRQQSARELRDALARVLAPAQRTATPMFGIQMPSQLERSGRPRSGGRIPLAAAPASASAAARVDALTQATPVGRHSGSARPIDSASSGRPESLRRAATPAASPPPIAPAAPALLSAPLDIRVRMLELALAHIDSARINLPHLSEATTRCITLARRGRLTFADAARILASDPQLRSRIMRLANSAAYPSRMPATTLDLAVARLGTQGLFNALIEFAARDALEGDAPRVKDVMRRIWPHAMGTALMAADLVQSLGPGPASQDAVANAYLSGLMADIGKPIVGHLLLETEREMERAGQKRSVLDAVLQRVMEAGHPGAGAAVCRHWELPSEVVTAVAQQGGWNPDEPSALSNLVRFSSALTSRLGLTVGICNGPEIDRTFTEGRTLLRVDAPTLKRVSYGFKERIIVLSQIRGSRYSGHLG